MLAGPRTARADMFGAPHNYHAGVQPGGGGGGGVLRLSKARFHAREEGGGSGDLQLLRVATQTLAELLREPANQRRFVEGGGLAMVFRAVESVQTAALRSSLALMLFNLSRGETERRALFVNGTHEHTSAKRNRARTRTRTLAYQESVRVPRARMQYARTHARVNALTYALAHSLTHSLTHSLNHSLARSLPFFFEVSQGGWVCVVCLLTH